MPPIAGVYEGFVPAAVFQIAMTTAFALKLPRVFTQASSWQILRLIDNHCAIVRGMGDTGNRWAEHGMMRRLAEMLGWRRMAGRWKEGVHNTWLTPYRHWYWAQLHLVCLKNTPSLLPSPPGISFISPSYKMLSICCCRYCCIPVHCLPLLFSIH